MPAINTGVKGSIIASRLADWIAQSGVTVTVVYPAARATGTVQAPVSTMVSPLTGPAQTDPANTNSGAGSIAAPTPGKPSKTVRGIWTDDTRVTLTATPPELRAMGWVDTAVANVRVLRDDALNDPNVPASGTIFDDCAAVIRDGLSYKVEHVQPVGSNFGPPHSYYVWLSGATDQ